VFQKIRNAVQNFVKQISDTIRYKTLDEKDISRYCDNLLNELIESDVAYDVAEKIVTDIGNRLREIKIPRGTNVEEYINNIIIDVLRKLLDNATSYDFIEYITKSPEKPVKIVFMGINGVGKTTTIAKVAYMLKKAGIKPVIVATDTFRAGAQEQLKKHSERLGIPFIGGKYGADPAAVAFDGIVFASKNRFDVVLIDTAGRMHIDIDLMNELKKVIKVVKPHIKVLVLDALTGNDAIEQARKFDEAIGIDGVILTKLDADASGGAAVSVVAGLGKKIFYVGVGQGYDDLIRYSSDIIIRLLFKQSK